MYDYHRNERAMALRPSLSRSWLLVRANSDEATMEAAFESEADSVILDLEDGCPADEKDEARKRVVEIPNTEARAWVRINAITTEHWWNDVKALSGVKGLRGVMLATTEHSTDIDRTAAALPTGTPIIALIESALGVHNADDPMALAYVRSQLVIASTLGGLPGPIDGPTLGKRGAELVTACQHGTVHGMTGKLTLDVGQADTINHALSPSEDEIQWAHSLLDVPLDGPKDGSYMPRFLRAKKVAELARVYGLWGKLEGEKRA